MAMRPVIKYYRQDKGATLEFGGEFWQYETFMEAAEQAKKLFCALRNIGIQAMVDAMTRYDRIKEILGDTGYQIALRIAKGELELHLVDPEIYAKLYNFYESDMPYGTQKARDGDPYDYITKHLAEDLL